MFVLDTNVVSETFKPLPDAGVAAWMDSPSAIRSHITAMTKAELLLGLAYMPDGKRKAALGSVIGAFFTTWLKTPVLAFGDREAEAYAEIVSRRRFLGRPIREFDAQIASVARSRGFAVVTRNVADFADCGVKIVNPWEAA
ncbi:type II toxin-antitoxin system VapC family toxin [Mesorhizobium sp. B292B1B]|uniref:type II toxin-antitoxin system VapC family toxin n=1 Tax=unclassified Mesorhizobium TaxID=325217 RepID=UPI0011266573|nr:MULTISPECIES: type II toxin-antitoxin system VapC family toxin [unclassified Mesorhizobium]MCA0010995.1 type II toxin-antitoxin system VapC family toxin [Mesorhizobium sp. B294B1A1]MCA0035811.1 type II toxin-antitoxin system VapC family toxin [Mesorhizobium sp. B292B1B]TPM48921.1 type II toxin-antitoxin system VapC family toxin [Mesorhizobium sp. B2-3-2]